MTANPQRVDVERQVFAGIPLYEAISLARVYAGSENKLRPRLSQTLESLAEALPALLQQLAEREAEVERLTEQVRQWERSFATNVYVPNAEFAAIAEKSNRAEAAERARDEACAIFAEVIDTVRDAATDARINHHAKRGEYHDEMADRIAAFLAANGGRSNGP